MTSAPRSVLIVGFSVAGLAVAENLRREGFDGELTVVGDEPHLPYDRPPLSKEVLGGRWDAARVQLRSEADIVELGACLEIGVRADSVRPSQRQVELSDGRTLEADVLVITTGVSPRSLTRGRAIKGVHALRTLDDALALQDALTRSQQLVVIGAGFLGTEVAAVARQYGLAVTMVDPQPHPLAAQLGVQLGALVGELHVEHGVAVRTGIGLADVVEDAGAIAGVRLTDGSVLDCDLLVGAVGSTPNIQWLQGLGLDLRAGVVCDAQLRAAEGIFAAGDVAAWDSRRYASIMRIEHRSNASDQGAVVARNILGANVTYDALPYFWSHQYDIQIHAHGVFPAQARTDIVAGSVAERSFVAAYLLDERPVGVVGVNARPRLLAGVVRELSQPPTIATPAAQ